MGINRNVGLRGILDKGFEKLEAFKKKIVVFFISQAYKTAHGNIMHICTHLSANTPIFTQGDREQALRNILPPAFKEGGACKAIADRFESIADSCSVKYVDKWSKRKSIPSGMKKTIVQFILTDKSNVVQSKLLFQKLKEEIKNNKKNIQDKNINKYFQIIAGLKIDSNNEQGTMLYVVHLINEMIFSSLANDGIRFFQLRMKKMSPTECQSFCSSLITMHQTTAKQTEQNIGTTMKFVAALVKAIKLLHLPLEIQDIDIKKFIEKIEKKKTSFFNLANYLVNNSIDNLNDMCAELENAGFPHTAFINRRIFIKDLENFHGEIKNKRGNHQQTKDLIVNIEAIIAGNSSRMILEIKEEIAKYVVHNTDDSREKMFSIVTGLERIAMNNIRQIASEYCNKIPLGWDIIKENMSTCSENDRIALMNIFSKASRDVFEEKFHPVMQRSSTVIDRNNFAKNLVDNDILRSVMLLTSYLIDRQISGFVAAREGKVEGDRLLKELTGNAAPVLTQRSHDTLSIVPQNSFVNLRELANVSKEILSKMLDYYYDALKWKMKNISIQSGKIKALFMYARTLLLMFMNRCFKFASKVLFKLFGGLFFLSLREKFLGYAVFPMLEKNSLGNELFGNMQNPKPKSRNVEKNNENEQVDNMLRALVAGSVMPNFYLGLMNNIVPYIESYFT